MAVETRHVMIVGLEVTDGASYRDYRSAMTPILKRHGGDFAYDFVVSEVLKSESQKPMNRVFALHFPDAETAKRFFANEEYIAVRKRYFDPAVSHRTEVAVFEQSVASGVLE